MGMGSGVDRLLVSMDIHPDRIVGTRAMDCVVVGHEELLTYYNCRPTTFKSHALETGAEWESFDNMGNVRWSPPEITFSDKLEINWNNDPLFLDYRPGPANGSIWADLPEQRVIFVGDSVMPDIPPFLAHANIPQWIESLNLLMDGEYQDYIMISSRSGFVRQEHVQRQISILERLQDEFDGLFAANARVSDVKKIVPDLLKDFTFSSDKDRIYKQRLIWGVENYYRLNYLKEEELVESE
jgi:glyoxylase-like metal-dependent hydrolase (beta-lactamase superfamily II)